MLSSAFALPLLFNCCFDPVELALTASDPLIVAADMPEMQSNKERREVWCVRSREAAGQQLCGAAASSRTETEAPFAEPPNVQPRRERGWRRGEEGECGGLPVGSTGRGSPASLL